MDEKTFYAMSIHRNLIPKQAFITAYSKSTFFNLVKEAENNRRWQDMIVTVGRKAYVDIEVYEDYLKAHNERTVSVRRMKELGIVK